MKDSPKTKKKVLIAILAYNEEDSLQYVFDDLNKNISSESFEYELCVFNDCSSDNTYEVTKKNNIQIINHPFQSENGMFLISTYLTLAFNENFDFVIQFDGDYQHIASYIPIFCKEIMESDSNMIIGSRYLNRSKLKKFPIYFDRLIGNIIISFFLRIIFGLNITDSTSGMRIYDKKAINILKDKTIESFDNFIFYSISAKNNLKISEIPVNMRKRIAGESEFTFLKKFLYVPSLFFSIIYVLIRKP